MGAQIIKIWKLNFMKVPSLKAHVDERKGCHNSNMYLPADFFQVHAWLTPIKDYSNQLFLTRTDGCGTTTLDVQSAVPALVLWLCTSLVTFSLFRLFHLFKLQDTVLSWIYCVTTIIPWTVVHLEGTHHGLSRPFCKIVMKDFIAWLEQTVPLKQVAWTTTCFAESTWK